MLPHHHKLADSSDFSSTIKAGRRGGSRTLVAHVRDRKTEPTDPDPSLVPGPRFGLIVSKAVGNAVVRHRTSRRLRHQAMALVDKLPANLDVVIRALPPAGTATSQELGRDLAKAIAKARPRG